MIHGAACQNVDEFVGQTFLSAIAWQTRMSAPRILEAASDNRRWNDMVVQSGD
jgi:hypothetical protein